VKKEDGILEYRSPWNMEYHNLDGMEYGILDVKYSMFRGLPLNTPCSSIIDLSGELVVVFVGKDSGQSSVNWV
jgi:hypothetical protein